jgi:glucosamine kinase
VGLYLGIDGGGTKTTCIVGDESAVLATATARGSNLIRLGEATARESLHKAVLDACSAAQVDPRKITRTCVGVAGAARASVAHTVKKMLAEIVSGEIEVFGDSVTALHAAFGSGPGIVVVAGTGSIALGRNGDGKVLRAGGWGFAVSDEGSGHWIGRTAISLALRARDQQQNTLLLTEVLKAWQLPSLEALIPAVNSSPALDFAALFPVVLACAEAGDAVARAVLTLAGAELASLGKIVARQLFANLGTIPLAMSGSVFRESALVREVFNSQLHSEFADVHIIDRVIDPVKGALELARTGKRSE